MKKILYILLAVFAVLVVAWLTAEYMMFHRDPTAPEITDTAVLSGESTVPVGGMLLCHTDVALPWFSKIEDISVESGKHAVSSGYPVTKTIKYGVFSVVKRVSVKLRALSPGETQDASFSFATVIGGRRFFHKVSIPKFGVAEPTVQIINNLQLAAKEEIIPDRHILRNTLIIAGVLLAAAILLTVLYFTRFRKKNTVMSEWEKTRQELSRLKSDVTESRITPENGFIRLTDLVRAYLEKRFGLPATRRTTPEFIEDISRNGNFIPDDRKPFLRNFLEAADQVKFAMAYPEKELLNKALSNAEALVDATRPTEEIKKDV